VSDKLEGWFVYFFLSQRGENVIKEWLATKKVPTEQIAAFQDKIDTLERSGPDMVPGFISETPVAKDVYKMKIKGNKGRMQLRPFCCRGPFGNREYTVLVGAVEKDGRLVPADAKQRAQDHLAILRSNPLRKRRERLKS
jgi:hypothetical protein